MRYSEIICGSVLTEGKNETSVMYHGTLLANVPSIIKQGLLPSEAKEGSEDRWATLGGVYLTSDFSYAVKAAQDKAGGQPIAVVVVKVSTNGTTPDEDVVEKALIQAFTRALDMFGVDDAYEADLDAYADAEEQRPLDFGEKPFDRQKFFRDFWNGVMELMTKIAGTPRQRRPDLIQTAVNLALRIVDHAPYVELNQWQKAKAELVALYPRLRATEQHSKSGLDVPRNIRVTSPIPRKRILAILAQGEQGWKTLYGSGDYLPVSSR